MRYPPVLHSIEYDALFQLIDMNLHALKDSLRSFCSGRRFQAMTYPPRASSDTTHPMSDTGVFAVLPAPKHVLANTPLYWTRCAIGIPSASGSAVPVPVSLWSDSPVDVGPAPVVVGWSLSSSPSSLLPLFSLSSFESNRQGNCAPNTSASGYNLTTQSRQSSAPEGLTSQYLLPSSVSQFF